MSEAKHTQGPWRYDHEPGCYPELMASDYATVALFAGEPSLANARRIVACVNACEGFSIEELEGANLFNDSIESGNLINELEAQRDELLEVLKICEHVLRDEGCTYTPGMAKDVIDEVESKIAKAEGGAA